MPKHLYASTLHVSAKKIAGKNPYPGPIVGVDVTTIVPHKPPRIAGFASPRGYGHLKISGHTKAHQIGKRK